jgi:hypothetical protein
MTNSICYMLHIFRNLLIAPVEKSKSVVISKFLARWHKFTRTELGVIFSEMFDKTVQYSIMVVIANEVRDLFIVKKSSSSTREAVEYPAKMSESNHGNVRYLAGRCVALARKGLYTYLHNNTTRVVSFILKL